MNASHESKCPNRHEVRWLTGTSFVCPVCGYPMYIYAETRAVTIIGPGGKLTTREKEVLALLARGLRNKEIGQRLTITEDCTEAHVHHIFVKLNVKTRTEAALVGWKYGLGSRYEHSEAGREYESNQSK
jgi:DNA-binding CsgD family transcriptional regulator